LDSDHTTTPKSAAPTLVWNRELIGNRSSLTMCMSVAVRSFLCQLVFTRWVCHTVRTVFSAVEHLTLEHDSDGDSIWSYKADRITMARSFQAVWQREDPSCGRSARWATLSCSATWRRRIAHGTVTQVAGALISGTPSFHTKYPFVDARQKAGRWSTLEKRVLQWNYWGGVRGEVFHRCLDYYSHSC
jgi:hypothetical protein